MQWLLSVCAAIVSGVLLAAENPIIIHSPAEGATLDALAENSISYEVNRSPGGDHVHLYVNDEEVAVLRNLKSTYNLPTLAPGEHAICIKIVNKAHTPTGVEQCVKVMVQ